MPLYELVYLCRTASPLPSIASTMKQKAEAVYNAGGVVRRLENMGIMATAYPMYRHREKHYKGRWIYMLFDASTDTARKVRGMVAQDTNIFRFAIYRQKNEFRDTFEENYFNFGTPKGEAQAAKQQPRLKSYLENIQAINQQQAKANSAPLGGITKTAKPLNLETVIGERQPLSSYTGAYYDVAEDPLDIFESNIEPIPEDESTQIIHDPIQNEEDRISRIQQLLSGNTQIQQWVTEKAKEYNEANKRSEAVSEDEQLTSEQKDEVSQVAAILRGADAAKNSDIDEDAKLLTATDDSANRDGAGELNEDDLPYTIARASKEFKKETQGLGMTRMSSKLYKQLAAENKLPKEEDVPEEDVQGDINEFVMSMDANDISPANQPDMLIPELMIGERHLLFNSPKIQAPSSEKPDVYAYTITANVNQQPEPTLNAKQGRSVPAPATDSSITAMKYLSAKKETAAQLNDEITSIMNIIHGNFSEDEIRYLVPNKAKKPKAAKQAATKTSASEEVEKVKKE